MISPVLIVDLLRWTEYYCKCLLLVSSKYFQPDPLHFDVDPDPRIHSQEKCIRFTPKTKIIFFGLFLSYHNSTLLEVDPDPAKWYGSDWIGSLSLSKLNGLKHTSLKIVYTKQLGQLYSAYNLKKNLPFALI